MNAPEAAAPRMYVRVLGPLQLLVDGAACALGGPTQRAAFAMLVLHRNRIVSSDSLVEAVWNGEPPARALDSVYAMMSKLRGILVAAGCSRELLAKAAPGYRLTLPDENCDAGEFARLKRAGEQFAGRGQHEQASARLSAALSVWSGEPLDDLRGFRFAEEFSSALAQDRLSAQITLARSEIACGRADDAAALLRPVTRAHPLHEPLWQQFIAAAYASGHPADALAAIRELRLNLADELGQDLSPPLRDLEARILRLEPLDGAAPIQPSLGETVVGDSETSAQLRHESGRVTSIGAGALRIGRADDNHIILEDPLVSRRHAVIIRAGQGFIIKDLHSSNGTFVGDVQVSESASLSDGDVIRVGRHWFVFELMTTRHTDDAG